MSPMKMMQHIHGHISCGHDHVFQGYQKWQTRLVHIPCFQGRTEEFMTYHHALIKTAHKSITADAMPQKIQAGPSTQSSIQYHQY
jgi:hypothetical protein